MPTYTIDADRTALTFALRRVLRNHGAFTRMSGSVTVAADGAPESLAISLDARTLRTGLSVRDLHLKTASFFDARRYPLITYISKHIEQVAPGRYTIDGTLRLHGRERVVVLDVAREPERGPDAAQYARVSGSISLAEFAVPPNPFLRALLHAMVGDTVSITSRVCLTPVRESVSQEPMTARNIRPQ